MNMMKRWTAVLCIFLLLGFFTPPAYANSLNSVEVWVEIHTDGSASFTEIVDLTMTQADNTEYYLAKHNLDNMEILELTVTEISTSGETVIQFETLDTWDMDASREEKAYKCGLVPAENGYEICWGFGELGHHRYQITYTLTNVVKGYTGGDAMSHNFLSEAAGGVDEVNIYLSAEGFDLAYPDTRVWVFGFEAESAFLEDGTISVLGQAGFSQQDYAVVMLALEPGLLSPVDWRDEPLDSFISDNLAGSSYLEEDDSQSEHGSFSFFWPLVVLPSLVVVTAPVLIIWALKRKLGGSRRESKQSMGVYERASYCREIPFQGCLPAAYTRLHDMNQVEDGAIIGCYLLKWIRAGHMELVKKTYEQGEEYVALIKPAGADMHHIEAWLFNIIVTAAGVDGILESSEFERWARINHGAVGSWLRAYRQHGLTTLSDMGAAREVQVPLLFGLFHAPKQEISPLGEEMTREMFGFKRYLQDFTIINEREAREVELWDEYLIFAQLFGIADSVASQFQQLYPQFFGPADLSDSSQQDQSMDIVRAVALSRTFADSMYAGYRSGTRSASSDSASSGGGGSSSSSGGGGRASGGGGAGGR